MYVYLPTFRTYSLCKYVNIDLLCVCLKIFFILRVNRTFVQHLLSSRRSIFKITKISQLYSVLKILLLECLGNFTTVSLPNWFMAQMVCRSEGKVLPSNLPNAIFSSQYYWTGYHIRRSNWIQIIGKFYFAANIDVRHIDFRKCIKSLLFNRR